ncbi:MAG: LarC family nickel insertion protein, partial [Chloroflexi bacterium]|nr:LarC family nickel insertion protein [Chloroflexota bacterium]
DAIVDIVGSVLGLRLLDIEEVYASSLPLGSGTVRAAHGALPVPAPATLELIAMAGAPVARERTGAPSGETLTPTGAAILTTLATFQRPQMTIESIGHGAGARETGDLPNVLRLWLGEKLEAAPSAGLILLETNIDDMSPELLGFAFERLFAQGAKDVWLTPIQMKKNRPAVMLSVLAGADLEASLVEIILRETTTLGVRVRPVERHESRRESFSFESSLGTVSVKVKRLSGSPPIFAPEYEECRRLAMERGIPLQEVYRLVMAEAPEQWRARHR